MNSPAFTSARYESYLLRLRWLPAEDHPTCQAMLQNVSTKERHYFTDLQSAFTFLNAHVADDDESEMRYLLTAEASASTL